MCFRVRLYRNACISIWVWASGLRASIQYYQYQACGRQFSIVSIRPAGIKFSIMGIRPAGSSQYLRISYLRVSDSVFLVDSDTGIIISVWGQCVFSLLTMRCYARLCVMHFILSCCTVRLSVYLFISFPLYLSFARSVLARLLPTQQAFPKHLGHEVVDLIDLRI